MAADTGADAAPLGDAPSTPDAPSWIYGPPGTATSILEPLEALGTERTDLPRIQNGYFYGRARMALRGELGAPGWAGVARRFPDFS